MAGWTFTADFIGTIIGSSATFFIAKRYGYSFLYKILDAKTVDKIKGIKLVRDKEIEGIFMMRVTLGFTLIEFVSYATGLLPVKYKNVVIAAVLSHLVVVLPIYYLAGNFFNTKNITITIAVVALGFFIFWKIKGRYFQ